LPLLKSMTVAETCINRLKIQLKTALVGRLEEHPTCNE